MDEITLLRLGENGSIPWVPHMTIGSGYNANGQQVVRSPFERLPQDTLTAPALKESVEIHLTYKSFRKSEDLESYMSTVSSGSVGGLFGVATVRAAALCLSSAKCNETNMTVIIRCTITLPAQHFDRDLELTNEAESCLSAWRTPFSMYNSDRFLEQYGQYSVTGWTRQASFFSTSTFTAKSSEKLNQIAAEIGSDFEFSRVKASFATSHMQKMSQEYQETSSTHEIFVTGLDRESIPKSFTDPKDILKAWNTFLEENVPIPSIAHLQHYANLNVGGRIPHPRSSTDVSDLPTQLAQKSIMLGILARSSPMAGVREQLPAIDAMRNQSLGLAHGGRVSEEQTSSMSLALETKKKEIDTGSIWRKRQAVVEGIDRLTGGGNYWPTNKWQKASSQYIWRTGFCAEDYPDLRDEIYEDEDVFNVKSKHDGMPVTQKKVLVFDRPNRLIIGAVIRSHWTDGTGGWWKLKDGGLHQHKLRIAIESEHYRGCDWSLYVWSVDRKLYQRV